MHLFEESRATEAHFPSCSAGPDELPAGCQGLANPAPSKGSFGVESKLLFPMRTTKAWVAGLHSAAVKGTKDSQEVCWSLAVPYP